MRKKRYLAAFGAAGLVFAGVFGAAAALDVNPGTAQSGQDGNLSCDENGVRVVGYYIEQNEDTNGIEPTSLGVVVDRIHPSCNGKFMSARVLSDGEVVGHGVQRITGNKVTVQWDSNYDPVPVSQIDRVSLAIT